MSFGEAAEQGGFVTINSGESWFVCSVLKKIMMCVVVGLLCISFMGCWFVVGGLADGSWMKG